MTTFRISIIFFFIYSQFIGAQNINQLVTTIDELHSQPFSVDKRIQLNDILTPVTEQLKAGENLILSDSSAVKTISTPDSLITVYYLTSTFDKGDHQLDWIMKFLYRGQNQVVRFSEKIIPQSFEADPVIVAKIDSLNIQGVAIPYYNLEFFLQGESKPLFSYHDLLLKGYFHLLSQSISDTEKLALNDTILHRLRPLVSSKELFSNKLAGFDKLSTLISSDQKLKVITWNIVLEDNSHRHLGFVVSLGIKDALTVTSLEEKIFENQKIETQTLTPKHWFGHVYYEIVDFKDANGNKIYLLLGARSNNDLTKSKVVEPLWLTPNGQPRFGANCFDVSKQVPKRLIYQYSFYSSMMLRFDEKNKMVVMDHLSPKSPEYQGNSRYYVPDFSYDGLKLEKGKWTLAPDIDLRNPSRVNPTRKPTSNKF